MMSATHTLPRCGTDFFTTWPNLVAALPPDLQPTTYDLKLVATSQAPFAVAGPSKLNFALDLSSLLRTRNGRLYSPCKVFRLWPTNPLKRAKQAL